MARPYGKLIEGASAGGTYDQLEDDPVRAGAYLEARLLSAEDEDNAPTHIRFGIGGGGKIQWIFHQASPSAGVVYKTADKVVLVEGEYLVCRFTGATSADDLKFVIRALEADA